MLHFEWYYHKHIIRVASAAGATVTFVVCAQIMHLPHQHLLSHHRREVPVALLIRLKVITQFLIVLY